LYNATFFFRQSGALKLALFQLGYRKLKFFDPETTGFEGLKTPGLGVLKCSASPGGED